MFKLRFWQKIYFSTLLFLLLALTIIICVIGYSSHQQYANAVITQAKVAHTELEKAVSFEVYKKQQVSALSNQEISYKSFENYYKTKDQFLIISEKNQVKVSTLPSHYNQEFEQKVKNTSKETTFITLDGTNYIVIKKPVQIYYNELVVTYIQDFSNVETAWKEQLVLSLSVGASVSIFLLIGLFFMIKKFTKPLDTINDATNRFAQGNYDTRLLIEQKDEFGDLADSFNNMAIMIEKNIHQLEEVSVQKQEMINNIAHEIRTPLTNIQGYGELLLNARIDEKKRHEMTSIIISESKKLKILSSKMLELGYLQNQKIEHEEVDLLAIIQEASKSLKTKCNTKRIEIIINNQMDIKSKGEAILLLSLFTNLLDNAINSMDKPGQIEVNVAVKDKHCIIEIIDQGVGMDQEQLDQLGNAFYRIDKSRSRRQGGHGLGVSLCHQIVSAHHASILYVSKRNEGTKVILTFRM